MTIRGREIRFMCTVEAHHKISAIAQDNNIDTVLHMLQDPSDTVALYTNVVLFTAAMSEGFEQHRAWEEPDYTPNPLTLDELAHLRRKELDTLFGEAMEAFIEDIGVSVETKEPQKKTGEAAAASA